jgi:hypothetical protein
MVEDVFSEEARWYFFDTKKQGGMGFRDLHTFNMVMLANRAGDYWQVRIP